MGLMQGKVSGDTMIVMDSFALPVEGTETRVNAQAEGYEYMVEYVMKIKEVGYYFDCMPVPTLCLFTCLVCNSSTRSDDWRM